MGVRWDSAEPGTSMCSQAEEPAPSLPDLGLLCMDKIKVLIEATLQRKESPDARTLLDGFMKIKWLLDVCLSPGRNYSFGSAAGSWEKKDHCTTIIYVSYPPIISCRRVQGSPCAAFAH